MSDANDIFHIRHEELVKIVKSFENLEKSEEWQTLKDLVFNKALISIDKQIQQETLSKEISISKLYNLQGQREWAKRYCDIPRFIQVYIHELEEINKKIK